MRHFSDASQRSGWKSQQRVRIEWVGGRGTPLLEHARDSGPTEVLATALVEAAVERVG